jgi:PAS domain S-box-containing protein
MDRSFKGAEARRRDAIQRLSILETGPEPAFDRLAAITTEIFSVPIAAISFVDDDRVWFKSRVGVEATELPRGGAFCAAAIEVEEGSLLVVPDTTAEPRFAANPLVTQDPFVRAYAGAVITALDGTPVGTLCIFDTSPRDFDRHELTMLEDLAAEVSDLLELRIATTRIHLEAAAARRLAAIVQTAEDAIYSWDLEGVITTWNPGAERLYGYTTREILGQSMSTLIPHENLDEHRQILDLVIRGDRVDHFETRRRRKDGSAIDVSLSISAIRDANGAVEGGSVIARDLTDLKTTERALAYSESRSRAILEHSTDAYTACDADGIIRAWNRRAETVFGWPAKEMVGTSLERLFPDCRRASGPRFVQKLSDAVKLGRPLEAFAVRSDGRTVAIEAAVWSLPSERPEGGAAFHALIRDVTDRKRAEAALAEQAELLDLVHEAIVARTLSGEITYWNLAAVQAYGWSKDEALGRNVHDLLKTTFPGDLKDIESELLHVGHWKGELAHLARHGATLPVASRWTLRYDDSGAPFQVLQVDRGIAEQRKFEDDLRAAREQAERASAAKSEFLSRMSHELRTPLNAILGFAQLLEADDLTPDQRDSTDQIIRGGNRLLELINEVLDIARIESGRLGLSVEPVRVVEALEDSTRLLAPLAEEQGVELRLDIAPDLAEAFVAADRRRLDQILLNLFSNAVKYNCVGGTATAVAVPRSEDTISIGVSDTGPGLDEHEIERLFMPFERLGAERSGIEGTGLGLALCKTLVEAMGGRINVESVPGRGSTFWIDLRRASAPNANALPDVQPLFRAERHSVLYIEDNHSNVHLVERLLERRGGVDLLAATTGERGLELVHLHRPEVILLDLHLPDMHGDEVLARLRGDPATADIPVIVLSADATTRETTRFLENGVVAYLTKPLDVPQFLEVLERTLPREIAHE